MSAISDRQRAGNRLTRRQIFSGVAYGSAAAALSARLRADEVYQKKSSQVIRMGIVGGNFGSSFFWHEHPNSKVTAVCDLRDDRLARLQKVYLCETGYKNYHEMAADKNVDAIGVFTPWNLHVDQAIEAMKAGKHVISAVPAGISVESCERLLYWVQKTGMVYMMAETSYYRPEIMACRRWAKEGQFGTIFYAEGEYYHDGIEALWYDEKGEPTWRRARPPLWYITHATGCVIPVMGERLTEVVAHGYGDMEHPGVLGDGLRTNVYSNPFWDGMAMFKTSSGHAVRINIFRHVAAREAERAQFFGTEMSYYMAVPGLHPNSRNVREKTGKIRTIDNYPVTAIRSEPFEPPNFHELLPPELRKPSGHGGSHTFLTHEFVSACIERRRPEVDIYEALAYTVPGQYAHRSALEGGTLKKIKNYDRPA